MPNPNSHRTLRVLALVGGLIGIGLLGTVWLVLTDGAPDSTALPSPTPSSTPATPSSESTVPSPPATGSASTTLGTAPDDSEETQVEGSVVTGVSGDADLFVAPRARGTGSGLSAADAADIRDLNQLVANAQSDYVIELVSDAGVYLVLQPINLSAGGTAGHPVTIRGPIGGPPPELRGSRADPYDPTGEPGRPLFRLNNGADHLIFSGFHCTRVGNGCFIVVAPIEDLTIKGITASNVRRFFENASEAGQAAATIVGLTISDVEVFGFSKGAIRLAQDTHQVKITDVYGDSRQHDGDNFAIGVHLVDTVHDVIIERVTMDNARDTLHPYWNGDGFAVEEGVYDILLVDTSASGNTDAGYDIKASSVQMINAIATDNKRNFRMSGTGIVVEGCLGTVPNLRGGTGTQAQVQLNESAIVELVGCTFLDSDPDTIVFDVDGQAHLLVNGARVERSAASRLSTVAAGASIELLGVEESTS